MIERYQPDQHQRAWDQFVETSRNGVFQFQRNYMDYHADRFEDHSLLWLNAEREIIAVMPANQTGQMLVSHAGLSFGGLVLAPQIGASQVLALFDELKAYMQAHGLTVLRYKAVPEIYHRQPSADADYALFRHQARLYRRDVSSCVELPRQLPLQQRRQRGAGKARKQGYRVEQSQDWQGFWQVLTDNLADRHEVAPVHTEAEIRLLAGRFAGQISLWACLDESGQWVAGTVIYDTGRVAHAQYIASSAAGRAGGALDLLFITLIDEIYARHRYFDFGISTEHNGEYLNVGLLEFKEGFGARAITHDFYEITTD
ncbi:GNAT family N-acetyltransferase [Silvimonas iriomotensis]|uniref:BioF2-like acetyltransferase domain-containing protein n=1 Tax=Silvimonas iriomotensis TaxID=449662 RepID=A0ABQ2P5B8_9NEIS|nr:GNAT family N-acetyltransferase [Silvimonas iriomotensis]GGP18590.1 hypothetical protein GCM10010970_05820 [Silvimonas iriomotensis]